MIQRFALNINFKKMKNFLLLHLLFVTITLHAQFGPQQIISNDAAVARSVYAADLDGDGDMDVLSASEGDDKVAWYENLDGLGTFGAQQLITANLHAAIDVFTADLDGDGDMDVLAASKGYNINDGSIVWYENLDGLGGVSSQRIISTLTNGAISVSAIDLDGDGDLDVLSASFSDNKVAWYENTDGLGNFGPQQIISNTASSVREAYAADLDGDGDMDVLAAEAAEDKVLWFENTDGLGTFGPEQVITTNVNGILSVYAIDIDGDDDMDVLSASPSDDKVAWYENVDGQGTFGTQQIISNTADAVRSISSVDVDNDGDMDVLCAMSGINTIAWFENMDSLGTFSTLQTISNQTENLRSVYSTDIDNDGDMDVLSASSLDFKIAWYENLTILSTNDFSIVPITIHPNPVKDILRIDNTSTTKIEAIKIYDVFGRLILQEKEQLNNIDVSSLKSGLLFVQLFTKKGNITKKVVKK